MSYNEVLALLGQFPLAFAMASTFILFALHRRWLVLGAEHREIKSDRDFWKELYLSSSSLVVRATGVAEKSSTIAEKVIAQARRRRASDETSSDT